MSYSETITKADLENVLNEVLPTPRYGGVQTASWTANSSNANNVKLTDSIHLTPGTYVITVKYPNTSATLATAIYYGTGTLLDSFCISQGIAMSSHSYVINIPFEMDIYVVSATSASITYTYKERGGLRAIQISESSISDNEADYIVEQGTDGDWTYRKWNSGIAECWCRVVGSWSVNFTSQGNNIYSASGWTAQSKALPTSLFTTVKYANVNVESSGYTNSQQSSLSTSAVVFRAWNTYAASGMTIYAYSLYVKGTWK